MATYRVTWHAEVGRSVGPKRVTTVEVMPDWEPYPTTVDDIPKIIATNTFWDNTLAHVVHIDHLEEL